MITRIPVSFFAFNGSNFVRKESFKASMVKESSEISNETFSRINHLPDIGESTNDTSGIKLSPAYYKIMKSINNLKDDLIKEKKNPAEYNDALVTLALKNVNELPDCRNDVYNERSNILEEVLRNLSKDDKDYNKRLIKLQDYVRRLPSDKWADGIIGIADRIDKKGTSRNDVCKDLTFLAGNLGEDKNLSSVLISIAKKVKHDDTGNPILNSIAIKMLLLFYRANKDNILEDEDLAFEDNTVTCQDNSITGEEDLNIIHLFKIIANKIYIKETNSAEEVCDELDKVYDAFFERYPKNEKLKAFNLLAQKRDAIDKERFRQSLKNPFD